MIQTLNVSIRIDDIVVIQFNAQISRIEVVFRQQPMVTEYYPCTPNEWTQIREALNKAYA